MVLGLFIYGICHRMSLTCSCLRSLKENLHDGGQLAKHLLSKGPEEMNTMTTMTLNIPSAKGAEVSLVCII